MNLRKDVQQIKAGAEMVSAFASNTEVAKYARLVAGELSSALAIPVTRILRDGQPVAEFTDASLARMAVVMFQSNEEANGNRQHVWTVEGDQ